MGFIAGSGSSPHASDWATWARPISPPAVHGYELFDMFCALNGATDTPRLRSHAQIAVVIQLLPALDDVPPTNNDRALISLRAPCGDAGRDREEGAPPGCHRDPPAGRACRASLRPTLEPGRSP